MAATPRQLDVWLVEADTVYRGVPFSVVTDWLEQGRLIADDKVRAGAAAAWERIADSGLLAPYLAQPEPARADDQAEALEAVELGVGGRRSSADDDDEVDMIPLIDISLVLLIFFLMAGGSLSVGSPINDAPQARNPQRMTRQNTLVIGMRDVRSEDGQRRLRVDYYINDRFVELPPVRSEPAEQTVKEAVAKVLDDLKKTKNLEPGQVRVVVEASQSLPFTEVQDLTLVLQELGLATFQAKVRGGPEKEGGP